MNEITSWGMARRGVIEEELIVDRRKGEPMVEIKVSIKDFTKEVLHWVTGYDKRKKKSNRCRRR